MSHFSTSNFKPRADLSAGKEYRVTGFINLKETYNETLGRYEQRSPEDRAIIDRLYRAMYEAGASISLTISERKAAVDVREFPRVASFKVFANTPRDAAPVAPQAQQPTQTEQLTDEEYGLPF